MKSRFAGFTLIEVMIVVAVIGLLVAVAFPSYQEHIRKGKRAEGKGALLRAAQLQERYFTDYNNYADDSPQAGEPTFQSLFGVACPYPVGSAENCTEGSYRITVVLAAVQGTADLAYTLTATPFAPFTDPGCGNLTLTSSGVKGRSGTAAMSTCW